MPLHQDAQKKLPTINNFLLLFLLADDFFSVAFIALNNNQFLPINSFFALQTENQIAVDFSHTNRRRYEILRIGFYFVSIYLKRLLATETMEIALLLHWQTIQHIHLLSFIKLIYLTVSMPNNTDDTLFMIVSVHIRTIWCASVCFPSCLYIVQSTA